MEKSKPKMTDCNGQLMQIDDYVILMNRAEAVTRDFEIWKVTGDGTYYPSQPMTRIIGLYSGRTDNFCSDMLKKIDINKMVNASLWQD